MEPNSNKDQAQSKSKEGKIKPHPWLNDVAFKTGVRGQTGGRGYKSHWEINKVKGDTDPFIISGRMGPRHCGKIHYKINAISSLHLTVFLLSLHLSRIFFFFFFFFAYISGSRNTIWKSIKSLYSSVWTKVEMRTTMNVSMFFKFYVELNVSCSNGILKWGQLLAGHTTNSIKPLFCDQLHMRHPSAG